jgi:hypothetical protein
VDIFCRPFSCFCHHLCGGGGDNTCLDLVMIGEQFTDDDDENIELFVKVSYSSALFISVRVSGLPSCPSLHPDRDRGCRIPTPPIRSGWYNYRLHSWRKDSPVLCSLVNKSDGLNVIWPLGFVVRGK